MKAATGKLRGRQRQLSARRRQAEGSAARERARNARLALAGLVALSAAITFGVHTTWAPTPVKINSMAFKVAEMKVPADVASRTFAENHMGRLFFDSVDGAICREMQFDNDTGRVSDEKRMRCDYAQFQQEDGAGGPQTDARAAASSIRGGFSR
jgi:hypothetical protein